MVCPNNESVEAGHFVTEFVHYRTGEIIRAKDYGKKAFFIPFPKKGKKSGSKRVSQ